MALCWVATPVRCKGAGQAWHAALEGHAAVAFGIGCQSMRQVLGPGGWPGGEMRRQNGARTGPSRHGLNSGYRLFYGSYWWWVDSRIIGTRRVMNDHIHGLESTKQEE